MKHKLASALVLAAVALAACGGGSSSTVSSVPAAQLRIGSQSPQTLGVAITGTTTLANHRQAQGLAGTPVSVKFNGTTVATGTLDANGRALLTFTSSVPAGSTVQVSAGQITASIVLAMTASATAVQIAVNGNGTITVVESADPNGSGNVTPGGPESSTETEDEQGNVISINDGSLTTLPSNLPIAFAFTCTTITVTPVGSGITSLHFEEKINDSDTSGQFEYQGPFLGPLTFPLIATSARVEIEVNGTTGKLLEIEAPLAAITANSASPGPNGCPTVTPTTASSPSASPSPSPTSTSSVAASPSPTPSPRAT